VIFIFGVQVPQKSILYRIVEQQQNFAIFAAYFLPLLLGTTFYLFFVCSFSFCHYPQKSAKFFYIKGSNPFCPEKTPKNIYGFFIRFLANFLLSTGIGTSFESKISFL